MSYRLWNIRLLPATQADSHAGPKVYIWNVFEFYPHDWMYARNRQSPLCVLCGLHREQRHILRDRRLGKTACPEAGDSLPEFSWLRAYGAKFRDWNSGFSLVGWQEQPRQKRNSNQPREDTFHSFVLHKSPFSSVSTVSRGHSSLVSPIVEQKIKYSFFYFCHFNHLSNDKKTYSDLRQILHSWGEVKVCYLISKPFSRYIYFFFASTSVLATLWNALRILTF